MIGSGCPRELCDGQERGAGVHVVAVCASNARSWTGWEDSGTDPHRCCLVALSPGIVYYMRVVTNGKLVSVLCARVRIQIGRPPMFLTWGQNQCCLAALTMEAKPSARIRNISRSLVIGILQLKRLHEVVHRLCRKRAVTTDYWADDCDCGAYVRTAGMNTTLIPSQELR